MLAHVLGRWSLAEELLDNLKSIDMLNNVPALYDTLTGQLNKVMGGKKQPSKDQQIEQAEDE